MDAAVGGAESAEPKPGGDVVRPGRADPPPTPPPPEEHPSWTTLALASRTASLADSDPDGTWRCGTVPAWRWPPEPESHTTIANWVKSSPSSGSSAGRFASSRWTTVLVSYS